MKTTIWRLSGGLAVDCSTLVDLPQQTHGLQWIRDELVEPRNRRLTLNGADDVRYCRQTLLGHTSIPVLFRSCSRTPAQTACPGYVLAPAASVSPPEAVSHGLICRHLTWVGTPNWMVIVSEWSPWWDTHCWRCLRYDSAHLTFGPAPLHSKARFKGGAGSKASPVHTNRWPPINRWFLSLALA